MNRIDPSGSGRISSSTLIRSSVLLGSRSPNGATNVRPPSGVIRTSRVRGHVVTDPLLPRLSVGDPLQGEVFPLVGRV